MEPSIKQTRNILVLCVRVTCRSSTLYTINSCLTIFFLHIIITSVYWCFSHPHADETIFLRRMALNTVNFEYMSCIIENMESIYNPRPLSLCCAEAFWLLLCWEVGDCFSHTNLKLGKCQNFAVRVVLHTHLLNTMCSLDGIISHKCRPIHVECRQNIKVNFFFSAVFDHTVSQSIAIYLFCAIAAVLLGCRRCF